MADTPEDLLPDATRRLIRTTDALDDGAYAEASSLPGWTRAHVLAHLALNAEGLAGVLTGIVNGEHATMYSSDEARDFDIAALAGEEPAEIRARLMAACTELADAIAAMPPDAWAGDVERTPGGRRFPTALVPTMRLREVEIHHADLGVGYSHADWSPAFCAALIESATARPDGPAFVAVAADADGRWERGTGGPTVTGSLSDLGWWLTGRGAGAGLTSDDGVVPTIGAL